MVVKFLLISDGSSDAALIPILSYVLKRKFNDLDFIGDRADFFRVPRRPKTLRQKIQLGKDLYEPDIIFIHRDCENDSINKRCEEIQEALHDLPLERVIKVIPLRMTEAWLLIDESAIRMAVGNPNGTVRLNLPPINRLERLPDPKETLESLLKTASELSGRRLASLNTRKSIQLVSQYIEDYELLHELNAFQHLKEQIDILNFN